MDTKRTCEECGAELPTNAPQGLCPHCLAKMGLSLLPAAESPKFDIQVECTGTMIGRYKLLEKIGEGGFGDVFMAEQIEPVQRKVALKIIKAGMDTKEVIARFEAERQAIALMDHPNIARALDAGATEAGRPYFVMELVRGIAITDYCDQAKLPTRERLQLFMKVCQAVQHAHQKGVIHRDLKPSNVLVTEHDGEPVPKVIDFGVAKALGQKLTAKTLFTAFHHLIGTPAYMSPEQAALSGLDIDTRADIYSLGVLLYELLTGATPFDADTFRKAALDEVRRMIQETEPPKPSTRLQTLGEKLTDVAKHRGTVPAALSRLVRGDLDWIVMRCLEKDRKRRYETANGLATDLARHLNSEPVAARPPSNFYRFQRLVGRNKLAFAAATAVLASLIIGLSVSTWLFLKEKEARLRSAVAEKQAKAEAERAEAASADAKAALAASDFAEALRLISEGNRAKALAFLGRSISVSPNEPAVSIRLASLLGYHTWWVPASVVRHNGTVMSAQFSPDGRRLMTVSDDNSARVWDAQTGQPLTEPLKHKGVVWSARFSPDGKRVVTASDDNSARVWDAESGQPLTEPLRHGNAVQSGQFSPDGKQIVTASWDSTARVWDAQSGLALTGPLRHSGAVQTAQFSPDGQRVLTASFDHTARVWDAGSGKALTEPLKHGSVVWSAQFSPDGGRIVTTSADDTARVWDAKSGQPLTNPLKHNNDVWAAQFSPDCKRIVTASLDNTTWVWDLEKGQPLTAPSRYGDEIWLTQVRPGVISTVASSSDFAVQAWAIHRGIPLTPAPAHPGAVLVVERFLQTSAIHVTPKLRHNGDAISAVFSPDCRRIVTAYSDNGVRVWDSLGGPPLPVPLGHQGRLHSAQFSPDGRWIVTASADNTAREWDAQSGRPRIAPLKHEGEVNSAQFSPDGRCIVTASADNTARVWDTQSGHPVTKPLKHNSLVHTAQFSPNGKRILTTSLDDTARVWNAETGEPVTGPLQHPHGIVRAQFDPDAKRIVTACWDQSARVWDAQTGQLLTEALALKHNGKVISAEFSPDGSRIVTASDDNTARAWDAASWQPLTEPLKHGAAVVYAQFSPNGRLIVTASRDRTVRIWDAESGQPLTEPLKHGDSVRYAQFSPDGRRVLTWTGYSEIRIWDLSPGNQKCPDWLPTLIEAIAGQKLNRRGVLEDTKLNRSTVLNEIRQKLRADSPEDDWVTWGRWFLADPATRTISPFSDITVLEYIENRIKENTVESLDEAERLAAGNDELLRRISEARRKLEPAR